MYGFSIFTIEKTARIFDIFVKIFGYLVPNIVDNNYKNLMEFPKIWKIRIIIQWYNMEILGFFFGIPKFPNNPIIPM